MVRDRGRKKEMNATIQVVVLQGSAWWDVGRLEIDPGRVMNPLVE
jgi:hypothetical protein